MKQFITIFVSVMCMALMLTVQNVYARAEKTTYPVVFVHGWAGFDNVLGFDYWGNDYGVFVGDPCDSFLEITCNSGISTSQKSFIAHLVPFQSADVRGLELANQIEGYMATTGVAYINLVGHSQGGVDIRKAAKVLYQRKGRQVVKVLMSISSPHRGTPPAKAILDMGGGLNTLADFLLKIYGSIVYGGGNDHYAAAKQFVYNDYDPNDGIITGMKKFNQDYPVSSLFAARYVSIVTAQNGLSVNPALMVLKLLHDGDGDGYCVDDCDNDGAAGKGDGDRYNLDDDGFIVINSQQMGYRLQYHEVFLGSDYLTTQTDLGYVGNISYPNSIQMTSKTAILNQDHMDVIGVGPDTFDEMEFYAAVFDYIAYYD